MKFSIIVVVMLSVFTRDKAQNSAFQCDKASFQESCKILNKTIRTDICKKENFWNQTIAGATENENHMDKLCSDIWSRCCDVINAKPSLTSNGTGSGGFSQEIQEKNDTNSYAICEIQRSKNLSLPEIARLVECVIQLWYPGKSGILKDLSDIEILLQQTEVEKTEVLSEKSYLALLYKHSGDFKGVEFYANESQISMGGSHYHSKIRFWLPRELALTTNETIVFLTLQLPNRTVGNSSMEVFEQRLFGLSVSKRRVSGLQERVNITISFSAQPNKIPQCVFLDYFTKNLRSEGCRTEWEFGQNYVRCLCDHFTYFGVLLVSPSISPEDQKILSYITSIGCGISLFSLVPTAFLFITRGEINTQDGKKIHTNLVIALILLNLHLLPSEVVAESSSPGLCLYMALALHYSLLATFCWMALEGFHLFLLMIKVFNIHISRYMLKISVVGWGIPALIVSIVVSIKRDFYGHTQLSQNSSMCYITDDTLKYSTSLGVLSLVFLFNTFTFIETVRYMFAAKRRNFQRRHLSEVKKDAYILLILMTLLGLTWGLIFFSFGKLSTPGLYIFSIFNSLQGFFIFIFAGLSSRKSKDSSSSSSATS